ncbi:MAG TPA: ATP synthase F1 subunit delta [Acholeplasmataceae bacterium]|nr:ATP synthase F1 subunit delta [Acholeplasmataceae bacterium]
MRTSNYAKALFELAKQSQKVDIIHYQFESLKRALQDMPGWIDMMDSPMVNMHDKETKIDDLGYDVVFRSFLKMLAQKNQMIALSEIFAQWNKLVRAHLKIAHVNVFSAKPLTKEQEHNILQAIQPTFPHHNVHLHLHVDRKLIGGLKIEYQGQALDRSIARELEELYQMI